ncbi:hypothetical protein IHE45_14G098100 [Dioscorea alata]|uniref:Uncharacterized protein n=1 Tax=Dioscorea alata TaxID=55571 RepID=A0ACB7UTM4_DIOAL|nr:hypothetical protein IHE45_14G098100 [Dioscorea alata]
MELNHKQRGLKAKLVMHFNQSTKAATFQSNTKIKSPPPSSTKSVGFIVDDGMTTPAQKQKTSYVTKEILITSNHTEASGIMSFPGGCIDLQAASYISAVRQRLKLEEMQ